MDAVSNLAAFNEQFLGGRLPDPFARRFDSRRLTPLSCSDLLDTLEIGHRAHSLPAQLSGGEQQWVAIGRALANDPVLIPQLKGT